MSNIQIITGENNEILRSVSKEVDLKLAKRVIDKMRSVIAKQPALGLAAPQIGKNFRIIFVLIDNDFVVMINPSIIEFSQDYVIAEEGCLSLPNIWGDVPRSKSIIVQYLTENGLMVKQSFCDMSARIIQHEIDHLNGILFIDKLIFNNMSSDNSDKFCSY